MKKWFAAAVKCTSSTRNIAMVVAMIAAVFVPTVGVAEDKSLQDQLREAIHKHVNGTTQVQEESQRLEDVKTLMAKGAKVDGYDSHGDTPLLVAVDDYRLDVIKYLLEQGADVNRPTSPDGIMPPGVTPLMRACAHCPNMKAQDRELFDLLLKNGADVNAKDRKGNTAWMYSWDATKYSGCGENGKDLRKYLEDHGAKPPDWAQ